LPSAANFLFVSHGTVPAVDLAAQLRSDGILVRHFPVGRIDNHLRISVGTDEECDLLLRAVRTIIDGSHRS
jgi:histidinol-phosphate aminotransferase